MRRVKGSSLLAGTMLALAAAAPTPSAAAPERIIHVVPMPPSLNGQIIHRHREAAPVPPPAPGRHTLPAPMPMPEPVAQAPVRNTPAAPTPARTPAVAVAPAAAPAAANTNSFDIKGTLNALLAASDAQIAEKLRSIVTAKSFDRSFDKRADEGKALQTFYAEHHYEPLWIHDGRLTGHAKAAIARLKDAATEGLDASDYPVPDFGALTSADALAAGDIKLTHSIMTFARHLAVGRIAPTRVSAEVDYGDHTPEPGRHSARRLPAARDVNAALRQLRSAGPRLQGAQGQARRTAQRRSRAPKPTTAFRSGPAIKPGAKDSPRAAFARASQCHASRRRRESRARARQAHRPHQDGQAAAGRRTRRRAGL